jgi:hypothetical protein
LTSDIWDSPDQVAAVINVLFVVPNVEVSMAWDGVVVKALRY